MVIERISTHTCGRTFGQTGQIKPKRRMRNRIVSLKAKLEAGEVGHELKDRKKVESSLVARPVKREIKQLKSVGRILPPPEFLVNSLRMLTQALLHRQDSSLSQLVDTSFPPRKLFSFTSSLTLNNAISFSIVKRVHQLRSNCTARVNARRYRQRAIVAIRSRPH